MIVINSNDDLQAVLLKTMGALAMALKKDDLPGVHFDAAKVIATIEGQETDLGAWTLTMRRGIIPHTHAHPN